MSEEQHPRFTLFFVLSALFSLGAVLTQFPDEAMPVPDIAHGVLVFLHVPLLLLIAFLDSRMGDGGVLHMQRPIPFRFALTLAFTYLGVVILTAWDLEIGPIDPTPPEEWDRAKRLQWFAMFTFGMGAINYMAATKAVLPITNGIFSAMKKMRLLIAVPIVVFVGCLLGSALLFALKSSDVDNALAEYAEVTSAPPVVIALMIAPVVFSLIGALLSKTANE